MPAAPDSTPLLEAAIGLAQRGALGEAEQALRDLLANDPEAVRAHNALGVVLLQQGRLEEAEASLLAAARAMPEDARAQLNLGKVYDARGRGEQAELHFREAIRLAPLGPDAHFNLAVLLQRLGRTDGAEAALRRTIELQPHDAQAHYVLARLLLETSRFSQAEFCYREAIRLWPEYAAAHSDLALVLLETGRQEGAQASCREALRIAPGFLRAWSNFVMCGQYDHEATDAELLARAKRAGDAARAAAGRFTPSAAPAAGVPDERLRLGIVSGDLHHHPVGLLLLPVLRELGRHGIDTTLYSNGSVFDQTSRDLRACARWVDISAQTDEQVWSGIRGDRQDILIDLAGHTGSNRLAVFAGRAAAVQMSWLGYFATTGTPNMDYVLMDPWHAPPGCESQFSERILRMPHTRFCFQPIPGAPPVSPRPPSLDAGHVTFGSFNNIAKVNSEVVRAWSRILLGAPRSRLVLKWRTLAEPSTRASLSAAFQACGIDPARLDLRPASAHAAVLAEYAGIDIALDPFPFTGGQTSFDAAWMGVPVVSVAGRRPVSRQTLCLFGNLGLQDLAAPSVDGFVESAIGLAQDGARIEHLRSSLREKMLASPMMQAPEFARAFADVLRNAAAAV